MQAILITAYKNFTHLGHLLEFFSENFSIYIHIDKKSPITTEELSILTDKKNVRFISKKYNINWGGLNHLKAILLLTQEALKDNENKYFHLITGHDYPIKNLKQFDQFYNNFSNNDFMEYHPLPYDAWESGGLDRLSRYNLYDLMDGRKGWREMVIKNLLRIQKRLGIKRKFSSSFPPLYGGSTYWSLKKESIEYIFQYIEKHPQFLHRFKYSFCSEEIFFQTILLNSPLKNDIINNNKRFIVWEMRNGNFPANLDLNDYDNISKSDALFARKFEYPVSQEIFSKIKLDVSK